MSVDREGNPNCDHVWVWENRVICTNPPIVHKICAKCGRVEHSRGEPIDTGKFDRIYEEFHGR